ncbi:MAG: helix-turn-helix transcriptional regulator [Saprospiraceae bacterium]|nr:helix-turn-helix transcriptional regulator [Saprospiraceae bacterium]
MTLVEMAKQTGISKSALSDYENNKSTPGLEILRIFSSFFSVSIDDILKTDITGLITKNGGKAEKICIKSQKVLSKIWIRKNISFI